MSFTACQNGPAFVSTTALWHDKSRRVIITLTKWKRRFLTSTNRITCLLAMHMSLTHIRVNAMSPFHFRAIASWANTSEPSMVLYEHEQCLPGRPNTRYNNTRIDQRLRQLRQTPWTIRTMSARCGVKALPDTESCHSKES